MKKIFPQFSLLLSLILLLQLPVRAQDDNDNDNDNKDKKEKKYEFEKTKSINKTYNVTVSDKLNIDNKFGAVTINVWTKQEIKVDIEIKASAKTEEWAKSVLDDIQVEDSRSGNTITLKTLHVEDLDKKEGGKRIDKYKNKNTQQSMETNYTVYMPAMNALEIENQFGATTLPDYKGEVDLCSKFGKLTTGNLTNVKNINVEFGKATLGNIPGGSLSIKYSKANIASLGGKIKLNLEFSSKVVLNLANDLNSLDMDASYSTVNLKPMGELPASYQVSTSFGSFKNKTGIKFSSDEDDDEDKGPKFDHEYKGKSGSGNVPVKVKSNFSTIILGDATEDELKGKDKDKEKNKRKSISI